MVPKSDVIHGVKFMVQLLIVQTVLSGCDGNGR